MTGDQVVEILDETVSWYRALGAQEQSATQPSDLLIPYANRQTADKVINLAFEIARANAELLSSDAEIARKNEEPTENGSSPQALQQLQVQLDARRTAQTTAIAAAQRAIATGPAKERADVEARLAELQSELDLVNARRNFVGTMSQFMYQSDANGSGAAALKEHIDAIAASIPSLTSAPAPATTATSSATASSGVQLGLAARGARGQQPAPARHLGSRLERPEAAGQAQHHRRHGSAHGRPAGNLRAHPHAAAGKDQSAVEPGRPAGCRCAFERGCRAEGDAESVRHARVALQADGGDSRAAQPGRGAARAVPPQPEVLARSRRSPVQHGLARSRHPRRHSPRHAGHRVRRSRAVAPDGVPLRAGAPSSLPAPARAQDRDLGAGRDDRGITFATEISSLATFAGLITAGLAVAMQSVLVSIVGYFFLIGKYGIRVGDRVQIGNVTGEVIELGLVRLHLMEMSPLGPSGPTGRVVAFANSIVFQASGGIFKQIPGVNLSWRDITLKLPPSNDYTALKERLFEAANEVIADYRDEFAQQTRELQKTTASHEAEGAAGTSATALLGRGGGGDRSLPGAGLARSGDR